MDDETTIEPEPEPTQPDAEPDRLAEEALRASEEKYRAVFETMIEACCIFDLIDNDLGKPVDWRILEANAGYERQSGLKDVARKLASEVMPGTEPYWIETFGRVAETGEAEQIEKWHQPSGRWIHSSTARVGGSGSRRLVSVFYDITERKRAEMALKASEGRQAFLLKLSDALRPLADPEEITTTAARVLGEQLRVNRAFYAVLDGDDWVLVPAHETGVVPLPAGRYPIASFGQWILDQLRAGEPLVVPDIAADSRYTPAQREGAKTFQVASEAAVPLVKDGKLLALFVVHSAARREWSESDLGLLAETAERTWAAVERARSEAAVRESETQLRTAHDDLERRVRERTAELAAAVDALQAEASARSDLQRRLAKAQEEERRRIARELHDSLGQYVTAMNLGLKSASDDAARGRPLTDRLAQLSKLAKEMGEEAHRLATELRPRALDDVGLIQAIQQTLEAWSLRTKIPAEFESRGLDGIRLPIEGSTAVYRVVQEALTNVAKHADATRVSVVLERTDHQLAVVIEDDGKGFVPDAEPGRPRGERGLGVLGMKERAALAGGELDVESSPNNGTTIFLRLPLASEE